MPYVKLLYHIIWRPTTREPLITPELEQRLFPYIGGIIRQNKGKLLVANAVPDHLHLYVSMKSEPSIADMLRVVKTNSSKWIHETFPDLKNLNWQKGYGAFSVSYSHEEQVIRYINDQKTHHRKETFKQEFIRFLKQYNIEYDERYIWDRRNVKGE
jgi:REP element-mobilizing transposase RayT